MILHIQSENRTRCLDWRHQFLLGSPAFRLFQFYETATSGGGRGLQVWREAKQNL